MDNKIDEIMDELNDMANFKGFGESKEIIIDGVDVAECEHINTLGKKIKCVILQDDVCEIDPYCEGCNCYYKQLKRLEQENAELKRLQQDYVNLSKSFEHLKTSYQENQEYFLQLNTENARLKSCLQEIKAIAEAPKPFIDFSETKTVTEVEYDYAVICDELELRLHKVLELITKAEEE